MNSTPAYISIWSALLIGAAVALMSGCKTPETPELPAANSNSERALAFVQTARLAATRPSPDKDFVDTLLAKAEDAIKAISAQLVSITQEMQDRQTDCRKQLQALRDKAAADAVAADKQHQRDIDAANSALMATLRTIIGASIVLAILGIGLSIYCKAAVPIFGFMAPLGKALAGMGVAGAALAIVACFVVQVEHDVTPVVVHELEWLIGGVFGLFFAALVYELIIHRKTIWEQAHDTAASIAPTTPFPPTVENLLNKVAPGTEAAKPMAGPQ